MPARALADADEAVKRRPDWPKAHFRRAEAFRVAGLHDEALKAYERAANLDPQDTHLQEQRILSVERARGQQRNALLIVCACGVVGLVLFALLALAPDSSETAAPSPRRGGSGIWGRLVTPALGTALGLIGGHAATLVLQHNRRGSVLPPLVSNDRFASMQMEKLGGFTPTGSKASSSAAEKSREAVRPQSDACDAGPLGSKTGASAGRDPLHRGGRSARHGRAAALKAMGKRAD